MTDIREKLKSCNNKVIAQNLVIKKISLKLKKARNAYDKKCKSMNSSTVKSPSKKSPSKKSLK